MNYEEWENQVPATITADSLWKMKAYRVGLWLGDIGWFDATKLSKDHRTLKISDQLFRSPGSISANLAEGYSLGTGKNRARFYEYALGSARESRNWYFKGRHVLGESVVAHRMQLISEIIRLLLTMIPQQRESAVREERVKYETYSTGTEYDSDLNPDDLSDLMHSVPLS